ncbi:MAG: type I-U CRISPR-associated protein Cas7 [Alphaproteobacteria bacterium]|nr:type I-U CRISPR-associated protein Cas7 [Alphaproteobacteria bacterium]
MDRIMLFFDLLIFSLMVPLLVYAIILSQRLKSLRKSKEDFSRLIIAFNDATTKAEVSTLKLKQYAQSAGVSLKEQVDKSLNLRDDLAFLLERGESMANRLETVIKQARDELVKRPGGLAANVQQQASKPALKVVDRDQGEEKERAFQAVLKELDPTDRSEVEQELLQALNSLNVGNNV